jgi:glycine/sarcosine N-methyltransferase
MGLYDSIAASYDVIFPVRPPKIEYAAGLAGGEAGARSRASVLDIGCATGTLSLELARRGYRVTGIDLDGEMIRIAGQRARDGSLPVTFEVLDMRRAGERFRGASFAAILCLGNTIPHLPDAAAVRAFLADVRGLLAPDGSLAVQLVAYERVVSGEIAGLPAIDNEHIRFTRAYRYEPERGRVRFTTELTPKSSGAVRRDETLHYPLTRDELFGMLGGCGLTLAACHADFSARPFAPTDGSYIAVIRRA